MKTTLAALAFLALAGAVSAQQGDKQDRQDIDVTVVGGQTTVTEEIARTTDRHAAVVWKAPKGFSFPDDGIVIESKGKDHFNCEVKGNGNRFRCAKLAHVRGDRYKYVVNLIDDKTGQRLAPLDPYIVND